MMKIKPLREPPSTEVLSELEAAVRVIEQYSDLLTANVKIEIDWEDEGIISVNITRTNIRGQVTETTDRVKFPNSMRTGW